MISVYILESLNSRGYYIGMTKNLEKRLSEHNSGKVHSTKNRGSFKLVYTEEYDTYGKAREREIEIKAYKGGNSFKKLLT